MTSKHPDSSLEENNTAKAEDIAEETSEAKVLFWCAECGQKYRLPQELSGKAGICFKCQSYLFIPGKSQTTPPASSVINFPCKHCGKKQRKAKKLADTEVKCTECGGKNIVPKKSKISSLAKPGTAPEERTLFWCNYCGQKYRLPKHLAGKSGSCDRCHNDFVIPDKSQAKPTLKKTTVFPCKHCGKKQWKEIELIGKEIECSECGGKNTVPGKSKILPLTELETEKKNRIFFWCCHCGQKYRLPRHMAGKMACCDKCQNDFIIPKESQVKPERRETIIFPCEHCGKKMRKPRELAGKKIKCRECDKENIVPEKSKKSLIDIVTPKKLFDPFLTAEATKMNLKIPQQRTAPSSFLKEQAAVEIGLTQKKTEQLKAEERILFWCGYCKQKYRLPQDLAGKTAFCDNCQNDLFIPYESQTKPEPKKAITFPCQYCGKKLCKPQKLAGTEITCHKCGEKIVVPKKSLLQKVTPIRLRDASIVTEATRTNLVAVGRPPIDRHIPPGERFIAKPPPEKVFKSKAVYDKAPIEEEISVSPGKDAYIGPQIIITEDLPTIHKIKNYFQQKAERYFIFAVCVVFVDYLINTYGEDRRPSKTFIIFSSFTIAAIILLSAWNYITYKPPSKTNKCRYNVMCTNPKCNLNEIRRLEDITKEKCSKCSKRIGLTYRCRNCNKTFVYDEVESKKKLKAKNIRDANRKAKWHGKKAKAKDTLFSNNIIKKCPDCRSENVYYVTVRQAEEEAEQKVIEKELQKIDKKVAGAKKRKKKN